MLHALDRFVLSMFEKSYQFLQRHFGLKLSTAIDSSLISLIVSFWFFVYFFDQLNLGITWFSVITASLMTICVIIYIFFLSPRIQSGMENFLAEGISNPLKINRVVSGIRCGLDLGIIFYFLSMPINDVISGLEFSIHFIVLSFWSAAHLMSVDTLPPPSSK